MMSIGDIRHIKAQFDVRITYSLREFRYDPLLGGGALMDLGCYTVHWARILMGSEPRVVQADCKRGDSRVDTSRHVRH